MSLLEKFEKSVTSSGAKFHSCDPGRTGETLVEIIVNSDHSQVICTPEFQELVHKTCKQLLPDDYEFVSTNSRKAEALSDSLKNSGVGVVRGAFGLIPQGAIAVEMSEYGGAAVSLVPEVSVIVIRASEIYEDGLKFFRKLDEYFQHGRDDWVLVSGPSSTADMGSLVTGVHGPKIVHVLVLEDLSDE